MTRILMAIAMATGLAGMAAADPVLGTWQTQPDDGAYAHIVMAPCGPAICGKIARTFNADGEYRSDTIGKTLVIDMVPAGSGNYEGSVWRPSNDKVYIGKMALTGDRLALRGCVAGGLICSRQTWARID
jgi:uncharacterized protein (DUF2147 family)